MTVLSPDNDCFGTVLGYGPGLLEVFVTIHHPLHDQGMVVYVPCGHASIDPIRQKSIHPKWQRYLYDVADALGGKSFIEACHCGQSNNLIEKARPDNPRSGCQHKAWGRKPQEQVAERVVSPRSRR